jgi:glyoxylase-like metal-dependent hydrolase (beta-lactamase superfamily II)
MIIKRFIEGQLENNIYLVADEISKKAVLIDATAEVSVSEEYDVEYILLTHGHFDHITGLNDLKKSLNAKALINENDLELSGKINDFTCLFGIPDSVPPTYDGFVNDGDVINVGNLQIKVITTPGHTQGGVCYLIDDNLFSGDTLFKGCIGRTDLQGGNFVQLVDNVKNKLFKLDDNVKVYPGHGDMTTIAYEKKYNEIIL